MKKIIALVFVLIFLFSFSGCGNTENKGNDISQIPTDTSFVGRIKDITNNLNGMCFPDGFDVEEPFFEDENYIYIFGSPISQYVIVEYTDGSTENIKEALENGHIQITDLDKYSIHYSSEPKLIEKIVDLTKSGEIETADAHEYFFSDGSYSYYFSSIKSQHITVYYKDGTEQNVKDALAEGKIKISDLDWLGIQYHKDPIE